jgi:hypothetical protein
MRCIGSQANYAGPIREGEELAIKPATRSIVKFRNNLQKVDLDYRVTLSARPAGLLSNA